jgi:hypothetical protein
MVKKLLVLINSNLKKGIGLNFCENFIIAIGIMTINKPVTYSDRELPPKQSPKNINGLKTKKQYIYRKKSEGRRN